jgi:NAD(P)-dependent dehydrogenase (short-subunit alcohol dehydrogenase family)
MTVGASGIGDALTNAYGQCGGASVLIADRDEPALETPRVNLTDFGTETHTDLVDLCDAAAVAGLAERAQSIGPINAACLNAGVSGGGRPNLGDSRHGRRVRGQRQLVGDHMTNMTEPSRSRDTLGHRVCCFEIAFRRSECETVDDCDADD